MRGHRSTKVSAAAAAQDNSRDQGEKGFDRSSKRSLPPHSIPPSSVKKGKHATRYSQQHVFRCRPTTGASGASHRPSRQRMHLHSHPFVVIAAEAAAAAAAAAAGSSDDGGTGITPRGGIVERTEDGSDLYHVYGKPRTITINKVGLRALPWSAMVLVGCRACSGLSQWMVEGGWWVSG